jgi:drug/metabolite transporter (DMT)-like permease
MAPMLVALAGFGFAGERLSGGDVLGIAVISVGIASLALRRSPGTTFQAPAVVWGIVTGLLVACYTVADGLGVRASGSRAGYIAWLFVLEVVPLGAWLVATRPAALTAYLRAHVRSSVAGGLSLMLSYAVIIYAMSRGELAIVSSLRETSVIFAALLGTLALKEPLGAHRVGAAAAVAVGVVLIQLW